MNRTSRRTFLIQSAAVAGGATTLGGFSPILAAPQVDSTGRKPVTQPGKTLRILILGGTGFIGPHQVRHATDRGHKVSVFNRGKTNPKLLPGVEQLTGDRNGDLEALKGREWDVVIDNPSTLPRWVRDAAQLLKGSAGQYIFISTISVYRDLSVPGTDESAATAVLADPKVEEVTSETYGGLKALAEKEAERAFPGKTTVIRPGLIVGPGDPTDRFTYWPVRVSRGGNVLAPGNPDDKVQFIDVRDLGEWTIRMAEQKSFGTYNATGPRAPLSVAEMLYGIRAATPAEVQFSWVPADFLDSQNVRPWSDMPVWIPGQGKLAGLGRVSNKRAVDKGLTFRPLCQTTADTLAWFDTLPDARKSNLKAGLTAQRESQVLEAWRKKSR